MAPSGEEDEKRGSQKTTCCCDCAQDEFLCQNFRLEVEDPTVFVSSQWCVVGSPLYIAYRVLMAVGLMVWLPVDIWYITHYFNDEMAYYWFLYATNWTLVGITVTTFIHAVLTVYYSAKLDMLRQDIASEECCVPFCLKFYWINAIICHNASLVIGVVYWAAIMAQLHSEMFSADISQTKHTLLMIYVVFDTFVSAYPVRIVHVVYVLLCMVFYVIFNGIYIAAGGLGPDGNAYIYYQLQYTHIGDSILTLTLVFLMAIVSQLILFAVFAIRRSLARCCCERRPAEKEGLIKQSETEAKYNTNEAADNLAGDL